MSKENIVASPSSENSNMKSLDQALEGETFTREEDSFSVSLSEDQNFLLG